MVNPEWNSGYNQMNIDWATIRFEYEVLGRTFEELKPKENEHG